MTGLLLFDIDGTLLRVRNRIGRRLFAEAFRVAYGRDAVDVLEGFSFSGRTDWSIAHEIAPALGLSLSRIDEGWPTFTHAVHRLVVAAVDESNTDALPGVHALLTRLTNTPGITLGLVTGNVREVAFHKLAQVGLESFFQEGAFGSDHADREHLPPLAIDRINARIGHDRFTAHNSVIVGDAPRDIACAKANGLRCVAVATGEFAVEHLHEHGAETVLESFADVEHAVEVLTAYF